MCHRQWIGPLMLDWGKVWQIRSRVAPLCPVFQDLLPSPGATTLPAYVQSDTQNPLFPR